MSGFAMVDRTTGYTLVRGAARGPALPACDLLLSDEGVLYLSDTGGRSWRCLGLVDPEALLDDLGVLDGSAACAVVEDVPPRPAARATL